MFEASSSPLAAGRSNSMFQRGEASNSSSSISSGTSGCSVVSTSVSETSFGTSVSSASVEQSSTEPSYFISRVSSDTSTTPLLDRDITVLTSAETPENKIIIDDLKKQLFDQLTSLSKTKQKKVISTLKKEYNLTNKQAQNAINDYLIQAKDPKTLVHGILTLLTLGSALGRHISFILGAR